MSMMRQPGQESERLLVVRLDAMQLGAFALHQGGYRNAAIADDTVGIRQIALHGAAVLHEACDSHVEQGEAHHAAFVEVVLQRGVVIGGLPRLQVGVAVGRRAADGEHVLAVRQRDRHRLEALRNAAAPLVQGQRHHVLGHGETPRQGGCHVYREIQCGQPIVMAVV